MHFIKPAKCLLERAFVSAVATVLLMLGLPTFSAAADPPFVRMASDSGTNSALKVLLIGNSLIYVGDLPGVLAALIKAQNSQATLKIVEVGGPNYTLDDHVSGHLAQEELQSKGPWDYAILQEQGAKTHNEPEHCFASGKLFANAARSVRAVPLLYETWGGSVATDYAESHASCKKIAAAIQCDIVPVGTALYYAQLANPKAALFSDGHHLSKTGQYLAACVLYGKLYRRSPEGLPYHLHDEAEDDANIELTPELARQLQNIAWRSVCMPSK